MNKKFLTKIVAFFMISGFTSLAAFSGSYYYDDGTASDNPDVNKFVPQSGVKIKESKMAAWMENSTKNAMNGKKNTSKSNNVHKQQQNRNVNTYKKSYKWF